MSQVRMQDGTFVLNVTGQLFVPPTGATGSLSIELPELGVRASSAVSLSPSMAMPNAGAAGDSGLLMSRTEAAVLLEVHESMVELWWPVGYGSPRLYDVIITFTPDAPAGCGVAGAYGEAAMAGAYGGYGAADSDIAADVLAAALDALPGDLDSLLPQSNGRSSVSTACTAAATASRLAQRTGFRTVELVRVPISDAVQQLFPPGLLTRMLYWLHSTALCIHTHTHTAMGAIDALP
jgi:hypothetical protein